MSIFDASNDPAAVLINGRRTDQGDEPYLPVTKIVFHHGNGLDEEEDRIVVTNDGSDWAAVASRIHVLLGQGYNYTTLPCPYCGATEMDDMLCRDECGEGIPHGHEHPGTDEDCDGVTYCDGCQTDQQGAPLEEL
jgi:hypothetical protein